MVLYSTLYCKTAWDGEFKDELNEDGRFHGENGDTECTFMHKSMRSYYYCAENCGAVSLPLNNQSQMWLFLPDQGKSVEDILEARDFQDILHKYSMLDFTNRGEYEISLTLPEFNISDRGSLKEDLQALGVTEIFDPERADFFPSLLNPGAFVSVISQATRVTADNEGVTAANYVEMIIDGPTAMLPTEVDTIDFTLDRPFLFVVTDSSGFPLFAGVVNEP